MTKVNHHTLILMFIFILLLTPTQSFAEEENAETRDSSQSTTKQSEMNKKLDEGKRKVIEKKTEMQKKILEKTSEEKYEARKQKYEEFKLKYAERIELKKEEMQKIFTEQQQARIALIKEHSAKTQARMLNVTEHLSKGLQKVKDRLESGKSQGISPSNEQTALIAKIERKIDATQTRIENVSKLYENLESQEPTQIKETLKRIKTEFEAIKKDLNEIKTMLVKLIESTE